MELCARRSATPAFQRSILETPSGLIELGELYRSRSRCCVPRWRLHTLLALIPAARALGAATGTMECEVRLCLERLGVKRRPAADACLRSRVGERLQAWLGEDGSLSETCRADLLQGLAKTLTLPWWQAPLHYARTLLAAGLADEARKFATGWEDPAMRHRLLGLTASGVWRRGGRPRPPLGNAVFVGEPFGEDFPSSLPRFLAMAWTAQPGAPLTGSQAEHAERVLARLEKADRQQALAHWAAAAYHAGGLEAGVRGLRAIRYRSHRQLAWLLLLQAGLAAGRLDDAWRILERTRGSFCERARLRLARGLIRHGRGRRGRRLLAEPVQAARQAERDLLLYEVHGRDARLADLWREDRNSRQAEDLSGYDPDLPRFAHRCTLVAVRHCPYWIPPRALRWLGQDRLAVRCFLDEVARDGRTLAAALRTVRHVAPDADLPIWSEHLSRRADLLRRGCGAGRPGPPRRMSEQLVQGLRARPEVSGLKESAESLLRSAYAYDEGTSWSQRAGECHRAVLLATKYCLKTWLSSHGPTSPTSPTSDKSDESEKSSSDSSLPPCHALESRLRTLANLGGGLAAEHLLRALRSVDRPGPAYSAAFSTLVSLAPERAARLYFREHARLLFGRPYQNQLMLLELEEHRALEPGTAVLWCRLERRAQGRLGIRRGGRWLAELMSAWPGGSRAVPTAGALECCLADTACYLPATGGEVIERAERRLQALLSTPARRLPAALLEESTALKRWSWLCPGSWPTVGRKEGEGVWRSDLEALRDRLAEVDRSMVVSLARRLAPPSLRGTLARLWLTGRWARSAPLPDSGAGRYRLRHLDKRLDLFTFLRFADCVPCCFNRADDWYRDWGLKLWVLALWKDPLSFCFHVEREVEVGSWTPCGFVFGSWTVVDAAAAVLLNGIYLRNQQRWLRSAILRAIEKTYCRPLGVRWIGIANRHGGYRHGGYGELRADYVARHSSVHRARALRILGRPVWRIYDDISYRVNQTISVSHLYWKKC